MYTSSKSTFWQATTAMQSKEFMTIQMLPHQRMVMLRSNWYKLWEKAIVDAVVDLCSLELVT